MLVGRNVVYVCRYNYAMIIVLCVRYLEYKLSRELSSLLVIPVSLPHPRQYITISARAYDFHRVLDPSAIMNPISVTTHTYTRIYCIYVV